MSNYSPPSEAVLVQRLETFAKEFSNPSEVEARYRIECLGDHFAEKNGWVFFGWSAVMLMLVKRHNWTPSQIRELSLNDLAVVLTEDLVQHQLGNQQLHYLSLWMRKQQ
ncbi:hypothetical protein D9M70_602360 [compost metagenome]